MGDLLVGSKSDAEADTIYKELTFHFTVKSIGAARFILVVGFETVPIYCEAGLEVCAKWSLCSSQSHLYRSGLNS